MKSKTHRLTLAGALAFVASLPSLHAQTWNGGGIDSNWSTAANWDTPPTFPSTGTASALTFDGTTGRTSNNETAGRTVGKITFNETAGEFTLTGSAITLNGNVSFSANPTSVVEQTIDLGIDMGATARQFIPQSNGNIVLNGLVTGTAGLIRNASSGGSLTLGNNNNSFSGNINVRGLGLTFATIANKGVNSAVGQGAGVGVADFQLGAGSADGELVYTGAGSTTNRMIQVGGAAAGLATQNKGAIITANGTGTLVFTGADFNVAQSGVTSATARALTLRGSNTGDNRISGIIRNNTAGASGTGNVTLTKHGAGKWILEGDNTYSGNTSVTAGTLATGATGTFGTGNITVSNNLTTLTLGNADSIADTATLTFGAGTIINLDFASTATETVGSVVLTGSHSLFLTAGEVYDKDELNALFGGTVFKGTGTLMVASAIPEPSTFAGLAGLAALAFGLGSRPRAKRTAAATLN
jgi:autotransporter-associated beta strand protein